MACPNCKTSADFKRCWELSLRYITEAKATSVDDNNRAIRYRECASNKLAKEVGESTDTQGREGD
jgi:hypothetical protein